MEPEDEEVALATFVSVTSCDPGTSRAVLAVSVGDRKKSRPFFFFSLFSPNLLARHDVGFVFFPHPALKQRPSHSSRAGRRERSAA